MKKIYPFLLIYLLVRIFAFFFSPNTPLYDANPINTIFSVLILITAFYFIIKKDERGWLIIAGEMILGGGGGLFQIATINLRTLLLIGGITIYFFQNLKNIFKFKQNSFFQNSWQILILITLAVFSAFIGIYHHHNLRAVYSDFVPYLFLLYYFPLRDLIKSEKFKATSLSMIYGAIAGGAIFILFSFFGFVHGAFQMQDAFYHFYRDIALGKITPIATGFWRLTLDEHLLLPSLILIFSGLVITLKNEKEKMLLNFSAYALLLLTLSINITRIYIIATAFAFLFLIKKENYQRWFKCALGGLVIFLTAFCLINLNASAGKSFGFELLGLRFGGITAPQTEDSAWSRALLLPKIVEKIKNAPIFGQGIGDTVTVYSPVLKQTISTPHFDWGYLEIIAENGILGLIIWIAVLFSIFKTYLKNNLKEKYYLLPALIALMVVNLTSPALFHALGLLFIAFLLSYANSKIYDNSKIK